ncbi:hypothetical protein ACFX13_024871 [Malus domestica]
MQINGDKGFVEEEDGARLLLWISFNGGSLSSQLPTQQRRKGLMSIKASFSNIANVLLNWNDVYDNDFCSWGGVFCNNVSLFVASLNLSNLNLDGEILPTIGDLGNLEYIDL